MSVALAVLLVGLLMAGVSAAIGVAAATVSQHELTRWVAYKLRSSAATRDRPLRSRRATISPISPRCTASGLAITKVRFMAANNTWAASAAGRCGRVAGPSGG